MKTQILNGLPLRDILFEQVSKDILDQKIHTGKIPGIAFIAFTGHQPLMKYTIPLHVDAAKKLGFDVRLETCTANAAESEMLEIIDHLNDDENVHAIILLQPVPKHIQALKLLERIKQEKEVEGFHPLNAIATLTNGMANTRVPMCLPAAFFELFKNTGIKVQKGQEFVFVADQDFYSNHFRNLILKTAASQVVPADCSVTFVNAENDKLKEFCQRADYLIVISERPEFLPAEYLKPGVCIIDIYSNLVKEVPSKKNPKILLPVIRGGVNTVAVTGIAGSIAPCPGGLMPVLLAILFRNVMIAFKESLQEETLLLDPVSELY